MNFTLITRGNVKITMCIPDGKKISSEADALDAVGACGEYETDKLLIPGENLSETFYDLKSGLAGAVLLKFSNYSIKAAVVVTAETIGKGRFMNSFLKLTGGMNSGFFRTVRKPWIG